MRCHSVPFAFSCFVRRSRTPKTWSGATSPSVRPFVRSWWPQCASGDTVVWERTAPYCMTGCSLHLLNLRTGSQRTVRLPSGVTATGDAAISPDGSTVAITGALGGASRVPYPQAVLLIGTHTQVARVLAGSEQATNPDLGPMSLTWSTNGWLFSSTVGKTTVDAWRPGESQARVLPKLRLPKVTHLVNEDPSLIAL